MATGDEWLCTIGDKQGPLPQISTSYKATGQIDDFWSIGKVDFRFGFSVIQGKLRFKVHHYSPAINKSEADEIFGLNKMSNSIVSWLTEWFRVVFLLSQKQAHYYKALDKTYRGLKTAARSDLKTESILARVVMTHRGKSINSKVKLKRFRVIMFLLY